MNPTTVASVEQRDYTALTQGAALIERPSSDLLLCSDADRHDFLHRITTANINALRPGHSAVTVLTSPIARVLFVFTVIARSSDLILLPAPGQAAALSRHLRGQIFFMDKVKVQDASAAWTRLRVSGPQATAVVTALGIPAQELAPDAWAEAAGVLALAQAEYDLPGYELLTHATDAAALRARLIAAGAQPIQDSAAEARRIELGRPKPGAELTDEVNPLEAGLAWACADNKGCYTGQEIIARQITYDKVTKSLVGLRSITLLTAGSELLIDGRNAGVVTSSAHSPALDAPVALAIVKRPHNQIGSVLQVEGQDARVMALPFA